MLIIPEFFKDYVILIIILHFEFKNKNP